MEKKRMTQDLFDNIKTLRAHGMTSEAVSKALGVSKATIYRVGTSKSLDAYRELTRQHGTPAQATPTPVTNPATAPAVTNPATPAPVTRPSDYQINRLYELTKEQNELLKSISAKLAYIVEQLA